MTLRVAIVGAGVIGRTLALEGYHQGWAITLFEQNQKGKQYDGASHWAAGMLAPVSELDTAGWDIYQQGKDAVLQWQQMLKRHRLPTAIDHSGSFVIAHRRDTPLLNEFSQRLGSKFRENRQTWPLTLWQETNHDLRFSGPGYWVKGEGHLDPRQLASDQWHAIDQSSIKVVWGQQISAEGAHGLLSNRSDPRFDWVVDCRGLGAQDQWPDLRSVKGEAIIVECPEVHLRAAVRLLHPRHPIYIVPRENHRFYIGATTIESDAPGFSVESAMELLSCAITVDKRFLAANIIETIVGFRPTLPDHHPHIKSQARLIAINGLYRHGFLLAPSLVDTVVKNILDSKTQPPLSMAVQPALGDVNENQS